MRILQKAGIPGASARSQVPTTISQDFNFLHDSPEGLHFIQTNKELSWHLGPLICSCDPMAVIILKLTVPLSQSGISKLVP